MRKTKKINRIKRVPAVVQKLAEAQIRSIQGGVAGGVDNDSPYNMPKSFQI